MRTEIRMSKLWVLLLLFSGISAICAEEEIPNLPPVPEVTFPFPVGETLTYTIYWGWIAVGESKATTRWEWVEDRWLLRIRFRTVSNGVIAKLYPVDDVVDTFVDPVTAHPVSHILNLQEGKHERKSRTLFDWEKLQAVYTKEHTDKEDEVKTIALKPGSRDLVSFMYFLRKHRFEDQQAYEFEVLSDYKLYQLTVTTEGTDKIHLDEYGKVKSLKLLPEAEFEGVFVRSGKMVIWLSDDERHLLTKLLLDTPFANVKLLLKSVEGPGAEDWKKE